MRCHLIQINSSKPEQALPSNTIPFINAIVPPGRSPSAESNGSARRRKGAARLKPACASREKLPPPPSSKSFFAALYRQKTSSEVISLLNN